MIETRSRPGLDPFRSVLDSVRLVDRYVFQELVPPFFFGLAIFTILFMATGPIFDMANLIIQYKVPILLVLKYAAVRIPSFIAYTLPMSVLLSTLVAFGRLSADHELIAMKAGGVSFYRILVPVFVFALGASGLSYLLNEKIGPESLYRAKVIVASREAEGHLPPLENIKFTSTTQEGLERITIAKRFSEREGLMQGPVISDYTKTGDLLRITHAREALWKNHAWILLHGETLQLDKKGVLQSKFDFDRWQIHLPHTPREVGILERNPDEMDSRLLRRTIQLMERDPMKDREEIRSLWVRYRIREALPFACLVFAMVGAPSGIRPIRSSSSVGVMVSVFIILIYYFSAAVCKSLGEHGTLLPSVAAWIPNLSFFILGTFLLIKEKT